MKNTNETKALIVVAAIKATRPAYGSIGTDTLAILTNAGYTVKSTKSGAYSIGQGSSTYRPADAFGVLMGLRSVDQRSVDGWSVSGLKIEGKAARVKDILNMGRRVSTAISWDK